MLRVAKREVITILRARARQAKANRGRDPDERPGPKGVGQAPANPLVALMTNERTEAVDAALERLDDESREVLVLHTTGGLDYGEIADLLGITERMAKRRFANAIRQVRHDLGVSGTQD